ncbi:hypothetical protein [Paraburkholderia sp. J10-1]|uniref:hypothetical protein n=1 Tax=Paraburkholderia sp. J10-1 TaxID=2805430 RepID=UPI002AB76D8C|nr:hypothetical protein [Paraburkholderia sp. J10-1]
MANLALLDLVCPYVLRAENFGQQHAWLSMLRVVSFETASDDLAIVIRGRCEFDGYLSLDLGSGSFRFDGGVDESAPAFDPTSLAPVFDIHQTTVEFELLVPRAGSAIIAQGVAAISAASFTPTRDVFDSWDTLPIDTPMSDYPGSGFVLDLVLDLPTLRPPWFKPAKLSPLGTLVPDPAFTEVTFTLPRFKFRVTHGNALGAQLIANFTGAGVESLDDPGDTEVSELISMQPPYALIDGTSFGFAFRSATLDLSSVSTPPALLEKCGVGDDWIGLYLPEARIFIAPDGLRDLAFEAGVKELLIGFRPQDGLWGDFEAALVNQGSSTIEIGARFIDSTGRVIGIETVSANVANAWLPAATTLIVDASGGRAPYNRQVSIDGGATQTGPAFAIDLSTKPEFDVIVTVTDAGVTPVTATLTIHAHRRDPQPALPAPPSTTSPAPLPALVATLENASGSPPIVIVSQNADAVLLGTVPQDTGLCWQLDNGDESAPQPFLTVTVGAGETHQVRARKPGSTAPSGIDVYFFFDRPNDADGNTSTTLERYVHCGQNVSTQRALSETSNLREGVHQAPEDAYAPYLSRIQDFSKVRITGHASYEGKNDTSFRQHNYLLARRRALGARTYFSRKFPGVVNSAPLVPSDTAPMSDALIDSWIAATDWFSHGDPNRRDWWTAHIDFGQNLSIPDTSSEATVKRPAAAPPPPAQVIVDPPLEASKTPDWFRSAALKFRIVRSKLIALEIDAEIDFNTAAEQKLAATGKLGGQTLPAGRTLQQGQPTAADNPADGITKFQVLQQSDPATGVLITKIAIGADPADKDGLMCWGWVPGEPQPADKDVALTFMGACLSFWPMLVAGATGLDKDADGPSRVVDGALTAAALGLPLIIAGAGMDWIRTERVMLYGVEFLQRAYGDAVENILLFDLGVEWSMDIAGIVTIAPEKPLRVRYKAIGLRLGNRNDDGTPAFSLHPVFDASRGYSIDLQDGSTLKLAKPLDQILRVLAARLSRTNPLTLEVDIGMDVDLGVIRIDRAGVRAYLDTLRPPELTALGASVDIPGALVGSGYLKISNGTGADGSTISGIAGQIDLTLRPISLRVSAALAVTAIDDGAGHKATGVYVGMNVVLPVALPLASSGLGIMGFRGIFGMHYERNPDAGAAAHSVSSIPALAWLEAAEGHPELLYNAHKQIDLWRPHLDQWSFGLGMLIGTMDGGVIMNLDGTLLIELPGPRVLILMNARIITPPKGLDSVGRTQGVLAVIEITPDHLMIGILIQWEIEHLIKIVIPVEALFPFPPNMQQWHIYLGRRPDLGGQPVEVDVLGIVRGTGYLVFKGDGLPKYGELPPIESFGIGVGVAASFTWGSTDIGLYLRIGGGMDAVLGLDPFVLAGTIFVSGELRLFIVSVGADARLTVIVDEQPGGSLGLYIHGSVCGHVSLFFIDLEGCVDITISAPKPPPAPLPPLVGSVSIKSRSPALAIGSAVDRGIDTSLGDALARDNRPGFMDQNLVVVPVDAIPVVSMNVLPVVTAPPKFGDLPVPIGPAPGLPQNGDVERSGVNYHYELSALTLDRIDPATGDALTPAVLGTTALAAWWVAKDPTGKNPLAQLGLLTAEPTPATKAAELTDRLVDGVRERWGTVCENAAPAAEVLWTFRWESLGASSTGWRLEGVAWPDPPHTRRSVAPDTTLPVAERWRSGNMQLDGARGILPAIVIGAAVPCSRAVGSVTGDPRALPRVAVGGRGPVSDAPGNDAMLPLDDPVAQILVRSPDQQSIRISTVLYDKIGAKVGANTTTGAYLAVPVGEILRRLQNGEPIAAAALDATFGDAALGPYTPPPLRPTQRYGCEARLLQAPLFDDGRAVVFGNPTTSAAIDAQLRALGIPVAADAGGAAALPSLDNVVVVHTGAFAQLDLLLFVTGDALERKRVVIRALDGHGNEVQIYTVSIDDRIATRPLPARWIDATGPWADGIAELLAWPQSGVSMPVHVALEKSPDAVKVEIGTLHETIAAGTPGDPRPLAPAYCVAAIGTLGYVEIERYDWDQKQIQHDRDTITQVLGDPATDAALLYANSLYRISATWTGKRLTGDNTTDGKTQTFWFKTEQIDDTGDLTVDPHGPLFTGSQPMPVRLDGWVLTTAPADGETQVFGGEPLRIVFNTADIDRLFGAYGKELRIRLQASSGDHPKGTAEVPHPFPVNAATLVPAGAALLSPWEDAASQLLSGSCIPVDATRTRQTQVDIPLPLDPGTGYLLDVELVPAGAPADARGPSIYRRHFATGAFATLANFAASLQGERVGARACDPGAMAAIGAFFAGRAPLGAELDDQFRAHGLEPLDVPRSARIVVFWSQTGNQLPQPEAVLIDATEPLWRSRPYPAKVEDTTGPVDATRWALVDTDWLVLEDRSAAGVVAPNGLLRAPGGQRALVVLAPNSRGKTVQIDLVEVTFPSLPFLNQTETRATLIGLTLDRAPWEET